MIYQRNCPDKVSLETRSDGTRRIVGYASVFYRDSDPGTEYRIAAPGRDIVERVHPNAFTRAISNGDDARALFNHDSSFILGRVSNDTVKLSVDQRGLRYEITPPDTQFARDVITTIERGDVDGSSFAFTVRAQEWQSDDERDVDIRWIHDVDQLYDVGPVTYPAYDSTSTGLRSKVRNSEHSDLLLSREAWKYRQNRFKESKKWLLT